MLNPTRFCALSPPPECASPSRRARPMEPTAMATINIMTNTAIALIPTAPTATTTAPRSSGLSQAAFLEALLEEAQAAPLPPSRAPRAALMSATSLDADKRDPIQKRAARLFFLLRYSPPSPRDALRTINGAAGAAAATLVPSALGPRPPEDGFPPFFTEEE